MWTPSQSLPEMTSPPKSCAVGYGTTDCNTAGTWVVVFAETWVAEPPLVAGTWVAGPPLVAGAWVAEPPVPGSGAPMMLPLAPL